MKIKQEAQKGNPNCFSYSHLAGNWNSWSSWTCSRTCGGGYGTRYRSCIGSQPANGLQACVGSDKEHGFCNTQPCLQGKINDH